MQIPRYCGSTEFARSLNSCQRKIDDVFESFKAGAFIEKDLNDFIMAARRAAYVGQELIKWRNIKRLVSAEAERDGLYEFGWE